MKNSKLSTPKVNCKIEDLDDSQIYETPIGGNKMENSFSNISETPTSRCETPTTKPSGNRLTGSPSNNKKKRSNRKRNKNKGGAKVKAN